MKINRFAVIFVASMSAALGWATSAGAYPIEFQFNFSSPFTAAQVNGSITFESSLLPNPPSNFTLPNPAVLDLRAIVTGAAAGNGTFGIGDFNGIPFNSPSPLDFSRELVGQLTVLGAWGTTNAPATSLCGGDDVTARPGVGDKAMVSTVGDFNLLSSSNTAAPQGQYNFVLAANGGIGECMVLTSMRPRSYMVPTLDGWSLAALITLLGLAGMAASGRSRRTLRRT